VVLAVYYVVPVKWRNLWLFVVNLLFYGWGERVYILLMLLCITINYVNGILIDRIGTTNAKPKRSWPSMSSSTWHSHLFQIRRSHRGDAAHSAAPVRLRTLGVELPIGISFYTFQTMSYPIDVYRGDAKVQKNYISFGTFVALFPQLIAGPIVRYKDIANQLDFRAGSVEQFASGVRRFTIGLGKKALIANNVGALWDHYAALGPASSPYWGPGWHCGIYAADLFRFLRYSDMAIGLGRMLGFEFLENFNYPISPKASPNSGGAGTSAWAPGSGTMSTSPWGQPPGLRRQFVNILIVWALTGIWHGANWTFLLWGLYYAAFLMIEKAFLLDKLEKAPGIVTHLYTLVIVMVGWVIFQLDSVGQCAAYVGAMFGVGSSGLMDSGDLYYLGAYALTFLLSALAATPLGAKIFHALPKSVQSVAAPALIVAVLVLSTAYIVDGTYNPFLYFKF
jgi:alginate O-acetyltransferase complex protein AlgI